MIISLISLALGVVAALLTYFFTPLAALPWPHAFWIIPMSLGYGLGAFMILVISFFLFCMAHPLEKDVKKPHRVAYWLVCQIIQWLFGFLWIIRPGILPFYRKRICYSDFQECEE